jgi:hypothetical protein
MNQRTSVVSFNIIFWSALFFYKWIGFGALTEEYTKQFAYSIVNIPVAFLTAYVSMHVVFDRMNQASVKWPSYAYLVGIGVIGILIKRLFSHYYLEPHYLKDLHHGSLFTLPKVLYELVSLYLMVGMYGMFYFIRRWYEQKQVLESLKQEKVKSELELLKSQVHPHFLFNMLNNIYSGALSKSPETAQQILQLSNFIEYNLYHSQKEWVPLNEELEYLGNYIALHQIRLGEKLQVEKCISDHVNQVQIPPLLLLPLIENAIKHGANNSIRVAWLKVQVNVDAITNSCLIIISNSFEQAVSSENGGVGLSNIRQRLKFLYPDKHLLNIVENPGIYEVHLNLIYG